MKFKIDENLPEELSDLFSAQGWSSSTVVQQQLGGEIDPVIAQVCREEARTLVTFDRGFANIREYPPEFYAGVVVFRLRSQDKPHLLDVGARLIAALKERAIEHELWIVHEDRIRIRAM